MNPPPDGPVAPRRIESVSDVEAVLASGRYSGIEAMECLDVARQAGDADLLGRVGAAVLERGADVPAHLIPALPEAAQSIVRRFLMEATSLSAADAALARASQELRGFELRGSGAAASAVDDQLNWVDELRMLLADDHPVSLTKVCSRMRDVDKPGLGVEAATRALDRQPNSSPALTTRAAALLDVGNTPRALTDAKKAWEIEPSPFVAPLYIRALVLSGAPERGIALAEEAFARWPDDKGSTAQALLSAAAHADDKDALDLAASILTELPPDEDGKQDPWVVKLAVEQLIEDGHLNKAEQVINRLGEPGGLSPGQVKDLRNRVRRARRSQQQALNVEFLNRPGSRRGSLV